MSYFQSTYHSKVFRNFKEIADNEHQQIIRFYESQEEEIRKLDFDEFFEMLVAYTDALFEVGAYRKHLLMVDLIIEATIRENIKRFKGKDIFRQMLFRKAASLFNLEKYDQADYILRELIKMDPGDEDVRFFIKKCLRKRYPRLVNHTRAASMFLVLLAIFLIGLELLFVRPFYSMHSSLIEISRNSLLLCSGLIYLGGKLLHRLLISHEIEGYIKHCKKQKK